MHANGVRGRDAGAFQASCHLSLPRAVISHLLVFCQLSQMPEAMHQIHKRALDSLGVANSDCTHLLGLLCELEVTVIKSNWRRVLHRELLKLVSLMTPGLEVFANRK